jgi:hypothetical protein
MEKNYRVNDERILMGCSLGGLITLYAWLTHTDMFTGYAAASPAVGWDREVLYKYEKAFAEKKISKPVRVYMTVGDVERGRPGFEKMAAYFKSNNYQKINIQSKVLENTGHSGTKSETFTRGLQYVFEKNKLVLANDVLIKYAGTYELPGGNKIELKNENSKLTWYFSPQSKIELLANTETHLYATHEFFNMYFKIINGKVEGFEWSRYGNTQFIKKLN